MSMESVMPSNHLILCCPLLLLPSIFPNIRVFSNESVLHIRWTKDWSLSLSFSISPSKEYSGLISFRMDWLDLLAVQGTLKSLLQHHRWKAWVLQCSAFFTIELSHSLMTTGKTIALTICTFVRKVMSLLFNILSRFVIAFLPKTKCLWSSNSTSEYFSKENKNTNLKNICTSLFTAALVTIARIWKQPKCLSSDEPDKEDVVYMYNGVLLSHIRMKYCYLWHE